MPVVAMMVCEKKEANTPGEKIGQVGLRCVTGDENAEFFKWTPWGECKIGTINEAAMDQFEVGVMYRVTFEKVEPNAPAS
jgi:hypothetical protein